MSRFTVTNIPYEPPQARNANNVGAIFDAYETASATVNEENFAEEGLTARVFESEVAQAYVANQSATTDTILSAPYAAAWALLVLGGATDMRVTVGALAANEAYRITSYLDVQFDPVTYGGAGTFDLWFRHAWDPTGTGVQVKVAGSQWSRRWKHGSGPNGLVVPPAYPRQGQHSPVMMESWILGAAGVSASTVELQWQFASSNVGATATVYNGILVVDRFKRVEFR
jgi:hypothetical protein